MGLNLFVRTFQFIIKNSCFSSVPHIPFMEVVGLSLVLLSKAKECLYVFILGKKFVLQLSDLEIYLSYILLL